MATAEDSVTELAHTSGPWEAINDEIVARDETSIAMVPLHDGLNPTEWQANMRLLAEAPSLLDACMVAVHTFSQPRGNNVVLEMATLNLLRMTIHAATGGRQ